MKAFKLALVAACMLVGATGAAAKVREDVALHISVSGVNFADPASVSSFRERVAREIAQVCNPGDRLGADLAPDFKCRRELAASFEPSIAAMASNAGKKLAVN